MAQSDVRVGPNTAWTVGQLVGTKMDVSPLILGVLTGAVLGAPVLGGGARLAMRMVVIMAGLPTSFTWPGSLAILAGGAIAIASAPWPCTPVLWTRPRHT